MDMNDSWEFDWEAADNINSTLYGRSEAETNAVIAKFENVQNDLILNHVEALSGVDQTTSVVLTEPYWTKMLLTM